MASKPLEQVTLADLATKDDLKDLVTKDYLHQELNLVRQEFRQELRQEIGSVREDLGSAVNMLMGEIGKTNSRLEQLSGLPAQQEETNRILARLVAKSEGVAR